MTYATKFKIVSYSLPVVMFGLYGLFGLHATRSLFAQTPPTEHIQVSVPKAQFRVGEDIVATVSNTSSRNVSVMNNCPYEALSVSRRAGNAWVPVHAKTDISKCAGETPDYAIPANSSVPVDYKYWPGLFARPGQYRIHVNVEPTHEGPSVEFTVVK